MDQLDNLKEADKIKINKLENNPDFLKSILTVLKKANKEAVNYKID